MKRNIICIIEPFCCTAVNNTTCSSATVAAQWVSCIWLFVTPWIAARQGLPVLHYLPEFAQTHVHWVGDPIQPSHPLLSPSAFSLSQHQGLFQWVSSSHQVAKVLELQLQHPMNIQDLFPLGLTGFISVQCKELSRVFPNTTIWKHQFFSAQLFLWSNSHTLTWILEKP